MVKRETVEKTQKEYRERKAAEPLGKVTALLKECHSNELVRIMKDIKHTHLREALMRETEVKGNGSNN